MCVIQTIGHWGCQNGRTWRLLYNLCVCFFFSSISMWVGAVWRSFLARMTSPCAGERRWTWPVTFPEGWPISTTKTSTTETSTPRWASLVLAVGLFEFRTMEKSWYHTAMSPFTIYSYHFTVSLWISFFCVFGVQISSWHSETSYVLVLFIFSFSFSLLQSVLPS